MLSAYIIPGFPNAGVTVGMLAAAERAGVDLVELGVPFSDPLADGPVIQRASQVSIVNGTNALSILRTLREIRRRSELPIILMGYFNSFINGIGDNFAQEIRDAGADGLIIPDLPLEESGQVKNKIESAGLSITFLTAPTSTDDRIRKISESSSYFSYCVSVTGVTGVRNNLVSDEVVQFLDRVRKNSVKPFVVGFGISTPEAAAKISKHSDGVVVGSALVQQILDAPAGEEADYAYRFLGTLRAAIDR